MHHVYVVVIYGAFFDVCFCLLPLFSVIVISGHNFISNSKDTAPTIAAVELIIKSIIVSLFLPWSCSCSCTHGNYQSHNFFSIQHWKILANGHWSVWKRDCPNFFRPTTLTNQLNRISIIWIYLKSTIKSTVMQIK